MPRTKKAVSTDEAELIYQDAELDFKNLRADLKEAAKLMTKADVKFFVNDYYAIQKSRVRHDNQAEAAKKAGQPSQFIDWMSKKWRAFESTTKAALQAYAESKPNTAWVMSLAGGGPVIAAGLDAHIDINIAKSAGAIWRFAGLDSSLEWLSEARVKALLDEMAGDNGKLDREFLYLVAGRLKRRGETFERLAKEYGWNGNGNMSKTIVKNVLLARPYNAKLKTLCVLPDQKVHTKNGLIPISQIKIGDEVLTHTGKFKKVTEVLIREYSGTILKPYTVGRGNLGPWLTAEHPVWTTTYPIHFYNYKRRGRIWMRGGLKSQKNYAIAEKARQMASLSIPKTEIAKKLGICYASAINYTKGHRATVSKVETKWMPISEIKEGFELFFPKLPSKASDCILDLQNESLLEQGDFVIAQGRWSGVPHPRACQIQKKTLIDADLAYVLGLYIAEGHVSGNYVGWSFHEKETHLVDAVRQTLKRNFSNVKTNIAFNRAQHSCQVCIGAKAIAMKFATMFGKSALEKHIPNEWLYSMNSSSLSRLVDGVFDGDGYLDDEARMLTTKSSVLAHQVRVALDRLGKPASVSTYADGVFKVREQTRRGCGRNDENGTWHTVNKIERKEYFGTVYNLEVEDDHSYVVEGIAVHNCWKLAKCFVFTCNKEDSFYGKLYLQRKPLEIENNLSGKYAEQAQQVLRDKNIGKETDAYLWYSGCLTRANAEKLIYSAEGKQDLLRKLAGEVGSGIPMLPPAHIQARAARWMIKIFLSHYFDVTYRVTFGKEPPKPYIIEHGGHKDMIDVPNLEVIKDFKPT